MGADRLCWCGFLGWPATPIQALWTPSLPKLAVHDEPQRSPHPSCSRLRRARVRVRRPVAADDRQLVAVDVLVADRDDHGDVALLCGADQLCRFCGRRVEARAE